MYPPESDHSNHSNTYPVVQRFVEYSNVSPFFLLKDFVIFLNSTGFKEIVFIFYLNEDSRFVLFFKAFIRFSLSEFVVSDMDCFSLLVGLNQG